jgi:hypothetical protein
MPRRSRPHRRLAPGLALAAVALISGSVAACANTTTTSTTGATTEQQPEEELPTRQPDPAEPAHVTDPEELVRLYLAASRAPQPDAAPRAAEAYMAPANPERGRGLLDPPPSGTTLTDITVEEAGWDDDRVVYRATYTRTPSGGEDQEHDQVPVTAYLVCEQQADGTWLILRDTPQLTPEP